MARSVKTTKTNATITRGTRNVFADLGYADAEERQTKLRLAFAINEVIASRRLTQTAAAEKLGINQPKVSALANYKLDGFSVRRLMTFLTALAPNVENVIPRKPRSRKAARRQAIDVLLDQRFFVLNADRYDALMHTLDNPPTPGPKLRALVRRVPAWRR
jgi:predicted XRE-type DNA-binding protein